MCLRVCNKNLMKDANRQVKKTSALVLAFTDSQESKMPQPATPCLNLEAFEHWWKSLTKMFCFTCILRTSRLAKMSSSSQMEKLQEKTEMDFAPFRVFPGLHYFFNQNTDPFREQRINGVTCALSRVVVLFTHLTNQIGGGVFSTFLPCYLFSFPKTEFAVGMTIELSCTNHLVFSWKGTHVKTRDLVA